MEHIDPSLLVSAKKKPAIVSKQRGSLRGPVERVAVTIGLFCTEVFRPELMTEHIEKRMGIPLTEVTKFNVKGEVLVYQRNGDVATIPLQDAMADYQRPDCRHCGDFSAEMAYIACGGVGTDRATIVVLRTQKAVDLWCDFEATGQVEIWPIEQNKKAWNILLRLARRQRDRPPVGSPRSGTAADLPQYSRRQEADLAYQTIAASGRPESEIQDCLDVAYGGLARPQETVGYMAGQPIPGDPGPPVGDEKRKLPPPPTPAQGGASPYDGRKRQS
jgi:coenzyme F420 hydrogenase subunit beta